MQKIIETERLLLREYTMEDFEALYEILSDAETMQHYPKPYDEEMTKHWIEWNMQNYKKYGFGIWAVVLKETGEFIGDCGMTLQNIDGEMLPEIGYHIHKKYWRKGFGSEAARAVRDWAFENTEYDSLYSYMKYTNVGSYSTAIANGMKKIKEYPDEKNKISYAYAITRKEWEKVKSMINCEIISLIDKPEMKDKMAEWFHEKWGIPKEAYQESMTECVTRKMSVPQWYVVMEDTRIIGGLGVIENDFHDRKDLAPNVCAVYTEADKRGMGIAGALLNHVCKDMSARGINTLYLVTNHTSFYERYGWKFLCMVQCDGEEEPSRMYVHRI